MPCRMLSTRRLFFQITPILLAACGGESTPRIGDAYPRADDNIPFFEAIRPAIESTGVEIRRWSVTGDPGFSIQLNTEQATLFADDPSVVERVEFYVNEQPVATLFQPPWVQPVVLPSDAALTYVRAVAYLPDGLAAEDVVFVNAPDTLEEMDVQFVELYTSALDGAGRPIDGLGQGDFRVFEDGVEQSIARFERVRDLPIHAGVLIDNSGSMQGSLEAARQAALTFFGQAIGPRDSAALITFNKFPHLAVKLTNNLQALGGGLAGLTAEGETALYDSLMFGLYYFAGVRGQRAILVLSDGKDEASRFTFEEEHCVNSAISSTVRPAKNRNSTMRA